MTEREDILASQRVRQCIVGMGFDPLKVARTEGFHPAMMRWLDGQWEQVDFQSWVTQHCHKEPGSGGTP